MVCENCKKEHDGTYGSGRFCNEKCAKSFSSREKRLEINQKVSITLTGRKCWVPRANRKCNFTDAGRIKAGETTAKKRREKNKELLKSGNLTRAGTIRPFLLKEQENKCAICGIDNIWNGRILTFDVDHINGDSADFSRKNLRVICPNCHRQTETFGGKNMGRGNTREYMKKYLSYGERQKILSQKRLSEIINV